MLRNQLNFDNIPTKPAHILVNIFAEPFRFPSILNDF